MPCKVVKKGKSRSHVPKRDVCCRSSVLSLTGRRRNNHLPALRQNWGRRHISGAEWKRQKPCARALVVARVFFISSSRTGTHLCQPVKKINRQIGKTTNKTANQAPACSVKKHPSAFPCRSAVFMFEVRIKFLPRRRRESSGDASTCRCVNPPPPPASNASSHKSLTSCNLLNWMSSPALRSVPRFIASPGFVFSNVSFSWKEQQPLSQEGLLIYCSVLSRGQAICFLSSAASLLNASVHTLVF